MTWRLGAQGDSLPCCAHCLDLMIPTDVPSSNKQQQGVLRAEKPAAKKVRLKSRQRARPVNYSPLILNASLKRPRLKKPMC